MLGLRELAMVATVVVVLYGRSGVLRSRRFQAIWPWLSPVRRKPGRASAAAVAGARREGRGPSVAPPDAASVVTGKSRLFQLEGNRLFWFLTILAATAVASAIVTRSLILQGAGPVPHP